MTLEEITNNIDNKIKSNSTIVKYTFYELRIKLNLNEEETYNFLYLARTRLQNLGYKIFLPNQKYEYNNSVKKVKENELLIAISERYKTGLFSGIILY